MTPTPISRADPLTGPIAAVLFDMDGTLVDSDAAVERAWRTWATQYGVDPDRVLAIMHGNPADRTVRAVRPDLDDAGVTAAADAQLALQYTDVDDVVPTAGAVELLAVLAERGIPWAVVTSADARLAAARLGAAGIDAPLVVGRDAVTAGKPDPEGYRLAARRLGVDPAACLVVEDTATGAAAGRAAGARVVGVNALHHGMADGGAGVDAGVGPDGDAVPTVPDLHAVVPLLDASPGPRATSGPTDSLTTTVPVAEVSS